MLIDGGANVGIKPEMLQQFGIMGSIYMEKVMGVKNPGRPCQCRHRGP